MADDWWVVSNLQGIHEFEAPSLAAVNRKYPKAAGQFVAGPFSKADADSFAKTGSIPPGSKAKAQDNANTVVSNPLDWLSNIGSFFSKLGQANTWLRIAEVVLGGALLILGVAKLAAGTSTGKAAMKVATKAAIA